MSAESDQNTKEAKGLDGPAARTSIWRPYLLPGMLALVLGLTSILSSLWLRAVENKSLSIATENQLVHVIDEVSRELDFALHPLFSLGWRYEAGNEEKLRSLDAEVRGMMEESPWLRGVAWFDAHGTLRMTVPEGLPWDEFLAQPTMSSRTREIFSRLEKRVGLLGTSLELPLDQGPGIAAVASLNTPGSPDGFVMGLVDARALLDQMLQHEFQGYSTRIVDEHNVLYGGALSSEGTQFARGKGFSFIGLSLYVTVTPGAAVMTTYLTWFPYFGAIAGSLFAILLGVVISVAFQSHQRAEKLQEVNRQLILEAGRRSRAELGEQEAKTELEEVLEQLPVNVWSAHVTPDGKMEPLRVAQTVEWLGRPPEDYPVWPDSWYETIVPEDRDRIRETIEDLLRGRRQEAEMTYRVINSSGEVIHLADTVRSHPQGSGRRLAGVMRDVTLTHQAEVERQKLEDRFQQAQKLESLGVLAGGIAHDFNNLLVGVLGHARLAAEDLPSSSPVQKSIQSIDRAARRAADLCRQMLAYAGKAPISIRAVDLRESVREIGDLLRASIPASSEIKYDFEEDTPAIRADGSQIQQVVLNLITNASEAIGESGGEIVLSIAHRFYDRDELLRMDFAEGLEAGCYVCLIARDTGCGMDEETRRRIFEPFYTTKFTGRGLGLAAVIGIVRGHHGGIRIQSEKGKGTTISVVFPATDQSPDPIHPTSRDPNWRGYGKVLVVEDDEAAREFAMLVLKRAGFDVLEAGDGEEGVEVFRQNRDEIRCVLLDLTMPNMDGEEALRQIRGLESDVPTLLCSGYPEQDAISRFSNLHPTGFLEKPYSPEALLEKVQLILDGEA